MKKTSLLILLSCIIFSNCKNDNYYTLSATYTEGGIVIPTQGQFIEGHTVIIVATPIENYHFVKWSIDVESTDNPLKLTMDANKTIKATFAYNDNDNDGVPDYMDQCPDTFEEDSVDENGCSNHSRVDDITIQKYLNSHNITTAQKDSSGIYYDIYKEGEGENPDYSTTVIIKYKGYFTNDVVFDETNGDETIEARVDEFIEGLKIGIQKMKPGGKATFYIPSRFAYGAKGTFFIPEWTVVIFDIELVSNKY